MKPSDHIKALIKKLDHPDPNVVALLKHAQDRAERHEKAPKLSDAQKKSIQQKLAAGRAAAGR